MEKYQSLIVNAKDIRIVNASDPTGFDDINTGDSASTIKVYDAGTLDVSAIFSDDGVTPLSNPFNADADGVFFFYAANGNYDVIVNESLATESKDISVTLFDPSEADYATSAQGAKADSALQPGDNVSELSNDADYIKADNVNLTNLDAPLFQGFQPNKLTAVSAPSGTDSDVTHTRASTATYIDRYDALKTAGIDELRETADGYQIEAVGSTNEILRSREIGVSPWLAVGSGSITQDGILYIDGVSNSFNIDDTDVNIDAYRIDQQVVIPDDSATRTFSVFVAQGSSQTCQLSAFYLGGVLLTVTGQFDFSTESLTVIGNGVGSVEKINDTWFRLQLSLTNNGSGNTDSLFRFYPTLISAGLVGNTYIYDPQQEIGGVATSIIPTTDAPATRAPDIVSMPYENNVPRGDQPYTIIFKGIIDGYVNFNRLFATDSNDTNSRIYSFVGGSGGIYHTNGSDTGRVKTNDITFGKEFTYVITSDGINYTSYLDGVLQATSPVTSPATELPSEMRILQGHSSDHNSNGKCSLFKTLPYALTADEVKLIS